MIERDRLGQNVRPWRLILVSPMGQGYLSDADRTLEATEDLARRIRCHALRMTAYANASHIGTSLSISDILAVLYGGILKVDPQRPSLTSRDRFVLSKGHGAAALYAVLAEAGFFPLEWLSRFCDDNQPLAGHVAHHGVPGVEASTGALGHGLPIALGMAIAAESDETGARGFALLSDGELDEGAIWEAALFAGHRKVSGLTAIVDCNALQGFGRVADVLDLEPLTAKWESFGWQTIEVDGHDHKDLLNALSAASKGRPKAILARTVKGKGVSFMEDRLEWHYRSPNNEQLEAALAEIEGSA